MEALYYAFTCCCVSALIRSGLENPSSVSLNCSHLLLLIHTFSGRLLFAAHQSYVKVRCFFFLLYSHISFSHPQSRLPVNANEDNHDLIGFITLVLLLTQIVPR